LALGVAFFGERAGPTTIAGLVLATIGVAHVERGAATSLHSAEGRSGRV